MSRNRVLAVVLFAAVPLLAACGSDEPGAGTTVLVESPADAARVVESPTVEPVPAPVELVAASAGHFVEVDGGSMAVMAPVRAGGLWSTVVSVSAPRTVTAPVVFLGTFTATDSAGVEHTGVFSDAPGVPAANPPTAYYVGGGPVMFDAADVVEVVYTSPAGDSYAWSFS